MANVGNYQGMPFTCENKGFRTKVETGYAHFPNRANGSAGGSYFKYPIRTDGDLSLFLEYVTDDGADDILWLMWYDGRGQPKFPGSAVFSPHDLGTIIGNCLLK